MRTESVRASPEDEFPTASNSQAPAALVYTLPDI